MGPSAAWFYEGQLRLHQNWNWNGQYVSDILLELNSGDIAVLTLLDLPAATDKLTMWTMPHCFNACKPVTVDEEWWQYSMCKRKEKSVTRSSST